MALGSLYEELVFRLGVVCAVLAFRERVADRNAAGPCGGRNISAIFAAYHFQPSASAVELASSKHGGGRTGGGLLVARAGDDGRLPRGL